MRKPPELAEFYRRKKTQRNAFARRPIAEKMAVAAQLRRVEEALAPVRAANKARRTAKQIKVRIKTA